MLAARRKERSIALGLIPEKVSGAAKPPSRAGEAKDAALPPVKGGKSDAGGKKGGVAKTGDAATNEGKVAGGKTGGSSKFVMSVAKAGTEAWQNFNPLDRF